MLGGLLGLKTGSPLTSPTTPKHEKGPLSAVSVYESARSPYDGAIDTPWTSDTPGRNEGARYPNEEAAYTNETTTSSSTASVHGMKSRRTTGDTVESGVGSSVGGGGADTTQGRDGRGVDTTQGRAGKGVAGGPRAERLQAGGGRGAPRSWDTPYTHPPGVKTPYRPEDALEDIPGLQHALQLFLEGRMMESEEYCRGMDPGQ